MKNPKLLAALVSGLLASSALLAFEAGGTAYTKRVDTKILTEPKPLAEAAASLPIGTKLKVEQVTGAWLRVSDGKVSGWVFNGNVSAEKPAEGKGLDDVPMLASKTSATAAARPLGEEVVKYAEQRNLGSAGEDLDWMIKTGHAISEDDVTAYLQAKKKGEFQ